ncbi:MAG TPA: zinc ABC transporter substrate-binding protein [Verrucomicrobiae bacterium]|nr:zinc ABC transporter substrate-binding protein [Verrucomicrobiae bacterium]
MVAERFGFAGRLLAAAVVLALPAVGLRAEGRPLRILTSFYPMYVHALNVAWAVNGVRVGNLTEPITGCLHDFQLTTVHMRALADADVLVVNGGGMESFLDKVIAQRPGLKVIDASLGIEFIRGAGGDGHEHGTGGVNPHVWVSPELAIRQVRNIAEGLATIDPARAGDYRANADVYVGKLEALRSRMRVELGPFLGRRVVTFHETFPYFAREFGLEIAAVVQRDPGTEPSPKELAETIDLVRSAKVGAVFAEPQYPMAGAEAVRRETGVKLGLLDPVVTGPDSPPEARDAYLRAMERNLSVLKETLR